MGIHAKPPAIGQVDPAIVVQHGRIKRNETLQRASIRIMYISVVFKFSRGSIAYGHADGSVKAVISPTGQIVIQVEPTIFSLNHIRSIHILPLITVMCALLSTVNRSLTTPITQIIDWCRPALIVQQTKTLTALGIVAAVQIDPVTKHMGFTVWDIGIQREERIEYLFFHIDTPLSVLSCSFIHIRTRTSLLCNKITCVWPFSY